MALQVGQTRDRAEVRDFDHFARVREEQVAFSSFRGTRGLLLQTISLLLPGELRLAADEIIALAAESRRDAEIGRI